MHTHSYGCDSRNDAVVDRAVRPSSSAAAALTLGSGTKTAFDMKEARSDCDATDETADICHGEGGNVQSVREAPQFQWSHGRAM